MNFEINGILGLIVALFTVASLAAGGAGYYKGSSAKSRLEARDDDIAAWEVRYNALKEDLAREKIDREHDKEVATNAQTLLSSQLNTANQRIQNLADVVKAQDTLTEIAGTLQTHDKRAKNIEKLTIEVAKKVGVPLD